MSQSPPDVLIINAVPDEFEALLQVRTGLQDPGWERDTSEVHGFQIARATFQRTDGGALRVVASYSARMGSEDVGALTATLVGELKPLMLAMTGICGGRRGDVSLGDVIFAERMWNCDPGKLTREQDKSGQWVERFEADPVQYQLEPTLAQHLAGFPWPLGEAAWLTPKDPSTPHPQDPWRRPARTLEQQTDWALLRFYGGGDALQQADIQAACPRWGEVLDAVWKRGWVQQGTLQLTEEGRAHIAPTYLKHFGKLPPSPAFKVHVAPIATGAALVKDASLFGRLSSSMRKVLGYEMEISALASLARMQDLPFLAAKGVSDFADGLKDDSFRHFAARASAECMLLFLRHHAPTKKLPQIPLSPGTEAAQRYRELAKDRPDAFLPDLAGSLNNLGKMLSELGRREEALEATKEAVQIRRELAKDRPDAFLPDLAMSLSNLGAMLSELGRREEALEATKEAVAVYVPLVRRWPGAFGQNFVVSLQNLAECLQEAGVDPATDEVFVAAFLVFQGLQAGAGEG